MNKMKMHNLLIVIAISLITSFSSCSKDTLPDESPASGKEEMQASEPQPDPQPAESGNILVAYFSFTGTTKTVATTLSGLVNGTLHAIEPQTTYGDENNNYYDKDTRAYKEQYGPASARPAVKETLQDPGSYDVILLGFPIWYGKTPRVVFSFLDTYSFKGKTVIPFITSGSTGIASAASELKSTYPEITWKTGDRLNGKTAKQLSAWLEACGIKAK